jgi:hypothetical protein
MYLSCACTRDFCLIETAGSQLCSQLYWILLSGEGVRVFTYQIPISGHANVEQVSGIIKVFAGVLKGSD